MSCTGNGTSTTLASLTCSKSQSPLTTSDCASPTRVSIWRPLIGSRYRQKPSCSSTMCTRMSRRRWKSACVRIKSTASMPFGSAWHASIFSDTGCAHDWRRGAAVVIEAAATVDRNRTDRVGTAVKTFAMVQPRLHTQRMNNSWWMAVVVMMIPAAGFAQTPDHPTRIHSRSPAWVAGPLQVRRRQNSCKGRRQGVLPPPSCPWPIRLRSGFRPATCPAAAWRRWSNSQKLGPYSLNDAAKPQTYGAYTATYTELKYDASKKLVLATSGHLRWTITANAVASGSRSWR